MSLAAALWPAAVNSVVHRVVPGAEDKPGKCNPPVSQEGCESVPVQSPAWPNINAIGHRLPRFAIEARPDPSSALQDCTSVVLAEILHELDLVRPSGAEHGVGAAVAERTCPLCVRPCARRRSRPEPRAQRSWAEAFAVAHRCATW